MKMISHHTGFIPGPVNVGVIREGNRIVLVDTGMDDQSAKRILKAVEDAGCEIAGILNTHAHADHYGGNDRIRKTLKNLEFIYAPAIEEAIIRYPILEPVYLFGANPIAELKGKFLMGKSSPAEPLPAPLIPFGDLEIKVVSLPGHSINQMGYICDNVFFCADTVFPSGIIEKYGLLYCFDLNAQVKTLHKLKNHPPYKMIVPCHARPRQNISLLVDENLQHIEEITEAVLALLPVPKTVEALVAQLGEQRGIPLKSIWQYHLHLNTIKAYLAALLKEGRVAVFIEKDELVWVRK
jgi:glyoxylase-like metal-dependent hydrolase (beta-lactamase superfamily II)